MKFGAKVTVKLKPGVKDAKGETVSTVLKRIGLEDNPNVRIGKLFELEINAENEAEARTKLSEIAQEVFVNPVVETYDIVEFKPLSQGA